MSSPFPLTGERQALNDRLQLLQPHFLFAESTYSYNGKRHDVSGTLAVSIKTLQQNGKTDAIIIGPRDNLDSPTSVLKRKTTLDVSELY